MDIQYYGYPKIGLYFRISIVRFKDMLNLFMDIQYSDEFRISLN